LPACAVGAVKARSAIRGSAAVALCVVGVILARASPYREATIRVHANGCQLVTDVIDKGRDEVAGSVVLIHGVAANKKVMSYLADAFAEQGLRVFVPDLPGHGRTPGPFSFARAETCAESLVQELAAKRMIDGKRTIIAGHSMGGAIAVRVAARVEVAGVIAVSPAPMRAVRGLPADLLPYRDAPPLHENTLVISAAFEPFGIRSAAQSLVPANSPTSRYLLIPRATHVSVLFDRRVARASEDWAAHALGLQSDASLPSSRMVVSSLMGFAGILLLAGPFLRETLGAKAAFGRASEAIVGSGASSRMAVPFEVQHVGLLRALLEMMAASFVAVMVLRFWNPFSFIHLFNGGYFASFVFVTGLAILLARYEAARSVFFADVRDGRALRILLAAAFGAIALHLLVTGWFDATLTESWPSASRWARFPVLLLASFAYLFAEELLLCSEFRRGKFANPVLPVVLRVVAWLALVLGLLVLHSGAILLLLLSPYIFLFFVLQSAGAHVVRKQSGSPLASALFGAILLAAFCLVIFPVT
jgi:pimeloyl-ACP methyl ester carboxylesterase